MVVFFISGVVLEAKMALAIAVMDFRLSLGFPTRCSSYKPAIISRLKLTGNSNGRGRAGPCFLFESGTFSEATAELTHELSINL